MQKCTAFDHLWHHFHFRVLESNDQKGFNLHGSIAGDILTWHYFHCERTDTPEHIRWVAKTWHVVNMVCLSVEAPENWRFLLRRGGEVHSPWPIAKSLSFFVSFGEATVSSFHAEKVSVQNLAIINCCTVFVLAPFGCLFRATILQNIKTPFLPAFPTSAALQKKLKAKLPQFKGNVPRTEFCKAVLLL